MTADRIPKTQKYTNDLHRTPSWQQKSHPFTKTHVPLCSIQSQDHFDPCFTNEKTFEVSFKMVFFVCEGCNEVSGV